MSNFHTILAIVGRPNVGKSTLFNRFVGHRSAIIEDIPGVTRDRNYGLAQYESYEFIAIDTGGFEMDADTSISMQMRQQAQLAVEEADAVIFVVDGREGITAGDKDTFQYLIKSQKPLFVAINKLDQSHAEHNSYEFYEFGIESVFQISAQHKLGITYLLEEINAILPLDKPSDKKQEGFINVAIIGKPNVGKSSLVNALLRQERMIVHDQAGTTRDPVDNICRYNNQDFLLIDTAGIRKKGKVSQNIEKYSIVSALRSIERADVVLLVIDAVEEVTDQVMKIAGYACDRKKAIVIVVNKWDLVDKGDNAYLKLKESIYESLHFISFAPIIFVSAKTGKKVFKIFDLVKNAYQQYVRRIQTSDLNTILSSIVNRHQPPSKSGRPTKIYYGSQVSVSPPTFVFMTNHPEKINASYEKYMIHQLRNHFQFQGSPLEIKWKKRSSSKNKKTF